MAFDFNSVNDTKDKPIVKALYEAKFTLSYEKFLNERNKILETLCIARGIKLWNQEEKK